MADEIFGLFLLLFIARAWASFAGVWLELLLDADCMTTSVAVGCILLSSPFLLFGSWLRLFVACAEFVLFVLLLASVASACESPWTAIDPVHSISVREARIHLISRWLMFILVSASRSSRPREAKFSALFMASMDI